jgi:hypothetical protein
MSGQRAIAADTALRLGLDQSGFLAQFSNALRAAFGAEGGWQTGG